MTGLFIAIALTTWALSSPFNDPVACRDAVVVHGRHRCTVLSTGMVRIETKGGVLSRVSI